MECNVYQKTANAGITDSEIRKIVFFVLKKFNKGREGAVSVHLVGEKRMKKMNFFYRGKPWVTDVIAFAMQEGKGIRIESGEMGDIFICPSFARRQACLLGMDYKKELKLVLVHGLLHLFGYDHCNKKEKEKMFKTQEQMIKNL